MTPRARVVAADGVPMSALVAESEQPRAVVLALHGVAPPQRISTARATRGCPYCGPARRWALR
ncbi:hypothetical protein I552_2013 [Mycobacterium xenopi 3993]|nr:hypothetical protein I552_2013 [Mycobacterium xenopi 3993]